MNRIILFTFFILLSSCARPNYVNDLEGKIDGISSQCGVHFQSENLCLKTEWTTKPTESSFGEIILTFSDPDDESRLIDPKSSVEIVLWMPSMGHGSSPVSVDRIDAGKFKAYDIFFIMPGAWDIRYQLKNGSNVVEQKIQKITI